MAAIRAKYEKGVLTPLEPLDLAEGAEVTVSVEGSKVTKSDHQNTEATLAGVLALVREMDKTVPLEEWDVLPRDLAKNKKHYLYGHPKLED